MKRKGLASSIALLGLLVVACGDDATPARKVRATYRAGTRLRPVVQVIEGGPSVFVGMYDTALGLRVDPAGAGGRLVWHPPMDQVYRFADPSCETPVATHQGGDDMSKYAIRFGPFVSGCTQTPRTVYEMGEELGVGAALYARDGDGKCVEESAHASERYALVGRQVPESTFASGDYVEETWAGGFTLGFAVSDDGAAELLGVGHRGQSASPAYSEDGVERWLPNEAYDAGRGFWRDAACTVHVANAYACVSDVRFVRLWTDTAHCQENRYRMARLGEELSSIYLTNGPLCEGPSSFSARDRYWAIGEEVPPSTFAQVRRVYVGARVFATPSADDDGNPIEWLSRWTDRDTGVVCTIAMTDAGLRCAPEAVGYEYEDAECTMPLLRLKSDACNAPVARYAMVPLRDGGFSRLHVGTGVFVSPAKVYLFKGGACEETQGGEYERLTPLASSSLPAVAEVIE